jgi:oxygen-independent coproporphyrinogen III oxidase
MAGIYIHVPFCIKKCLYCDFYSIGVNDKISQYHILIDQELLLRNDFINNEEVDTIYFGGGTPSLLSPSQVGHILNSIAKVFKISINAEITVEINPDDISEELLIGFHSFGVNRISLGVQSFIDDELRLLGRRHNAFVAEQSIDQILKSGFENVSIDLIYGIPNSTLDSWDYSLKKAFSYNVKHLSCYHLTYEKGTPLTRSLNSNNIHEVDESISAQQFDHLRKLAHSNSFIHYEVSNLAKDGFFSRHNTSYWKEIHYLGLGPSAHSYNGLQRVWNPNSYKDWEKGIEIQQPATNSEKIDIQMKFNEKILTHLRTIWGINLAELKNEFEKKMIDSLIQNAKNHLDAKRLIIVDNHLIIPSEYFFISDGIIGDLILVDD